LWNSERIECNNALFDQLINPPSTVEGFPSSMKVKSDNITPLGKKLKQ